MHVDTIVIIKCWSGDQSMSFEGTMKCVCVHKMREDYELEHEPNIKNR